MTAKTESIRIDAKRLLSCIGKSIDDCDDEVIDIYIELLALIGQRSGYERTIEGLAVVAAEYADQTELSVAETDVLGVIMELAYRIGLREEDRDEK